MSMLEGDIRWKETKERKLAARSFWHSIDMPGRIGETDYTMTQEKRYFSRKDFADSYVEQKRRYKWQHMRYNLREGMTTT